MSKKGLPMNLSGIMGGANKPKQVPLGDVTGMHQHQLEMQGVPSQRIKHTEVTEDGSTIEIDALVTPDQFIVTELDARDADGTNWADKGDKPEPHQG